MEKPPSKPAIQHFSHEHVLEPRLLLPEENCVCFGCKLEVSPGKICYKCKICPFYLHQVCYNMPQKVQHPVDPNHHLTLLALPFSKEESIDCEACQQSISGFYYNCATCATFYHMLCLATPLSVKLPVHPHKLELEFSPPYQFQCDLCHRPSHRGWLYRCGLCEVDVHISCAIMDSQDKLQSHTAETKPESINVRRDSHHSKRHELMELLLQGIVDTTQDKQAFQYQQLTPLSDSIATPSIQFSDACFSIDIERSFTGDHDHSIDYKVGELQKKAVESQDTKKVSYVLVNKGSFQDPKKANNLMQIPSFSSYIGGPRKSEEIGILPASTIGSDVWVELGRNNEPNQAKKASNSGLQHQGKDTNSGCWCSCW